MTKSAWMIVTPADNPVSHNAQLPIYWLRRVAIADAKDIHGGARVVKIAIPLALPVGARDD
jgi:hypothetical protein